MKRFTGEQCVTKRSTGRPLRDEALHGLTVGRWGEVRDELHGGSFA